jgi:hypothetical protein
MGDGARKGSDVENTREREGRVGDGSNKDFGQNYSSIQQGRRFAEPNQVITECETRLCKAEILGPSEVELKL